MIGMQELNDAVAALNDLAEADAAIGENTIIAFVQEFEINGDDLREFVFAQTTNIVINSPDMAAGIVALVVFGFQVGFLLGRSSIQNGAEAQ